MKNHIIKMVLEPIAEFIIIQVKNNEGEMAKKWFEIGMELDFYLTLFHNIYLFGEV